MSSGEFATNGHCHRFCSNTQERAEEEQPQHNPFKKLKALFQSKHKRNEGNDSARHRSDPRVTQEDANDEDERCSEEGRAPKRCCFVPQSGRWSRKVADKMKDLATRFASKLRKQNRNFESANSGQNVSEDASAPATRHSRLSFQQATGLADASEISKVIEKSPRQVERARAKKYLRLHLERVLDSASNIDFPSTAECPPPSKETQRYLQWHAELAMKSLAYLGIDDTQDSSASLSNPGKKFSQSSEDRTVNEGDETVSLAVSTSRDTMSGNNAEQNSIAMDEARRFEAGGNKLGDLSFSSNSKSDVQALSDSIQARLGSSFSDNTDPGLRGAELGNSALLAKSGAGNCPSQPSKLVESDFRPENKKEVRGTSIKSEGSTVSDRPADMELSTVFIGLSSLEESTEKMENETTGNADMQSVEHSNGSDRNTENTQLESSDDGNQSEDSCAEPQTDEVDDWIYHNGLNDKVFWQGFGLLLVVTVSSIGAQWVWGETC